MSTDLARTDAVTATLLCTWFYEAMAICLLLAADAAVDEEPLRDT